MREVKQQPNASRLRLVYHPSRRRSVPSSSPRARLVSQVKAAVAPIAIGLDCDCACK